MKKEELIPELLRDVFQEFSSLQSDTEKEAFWTEMAKYAEKVPPHILKGQLKEGVSTLSSQVQVLYEKVKDKIPI